MSEKISRRKTLLGTSTALTSGLAGCMGDVLNSNSKSANNDSLQEDLSSARSKLESRNEELDSLEQELQQREQRIQELEGQTSKQSDFSEETLSQFRSVAETVRQAVVTISGSGGGDGTAWFVDSNTLLTNAHVVDGSDSFECFTIGGDSFSPKLLGASNYLNRPYHDVAVLETDYTAETSLSIGDSTSLEREQPVLHVGHPSKVGNWVISIGRYQSDGLGDDILTSVPGGSGSSGSPLVNTSGDVIGLTTGATLRPVSSGDPEPVEFELKEEFEDTTQSTHDTSSTINTYLKEFR